MPSAATTNQVEPPLIRALLTKPASYDHLVGHVQLIETHISWVLLTGEFAYKIKKPLDLGFLNFSTLKLRQQACTDEVRLNRRLAAPFYLGVVPISGSPDAPHINDPLIGDKGAAFEYAVKMRQFPPAATLDRMDVRGELGTAQIDQIAARLAQFHLNECDRASADSPWGEPDTIARPVAENFQLLASRLDDPDEKRRLARLQDWMNNEYQRLVPLMRERKRDGFIRECHGDLHLGNLAWVDEQLVIFDCIEFSAALRWIDIISEVAFCYMDLMHRHHPDLAMRFINAWLEKTGDYAGIALLHYYAVYRALVRAKVAALRAEQSGGSDATANRAEVSACLLLAEQLTRKTPAQLWITHGLSGSGKTTLTQSLLQQHGVIRLRSDIERKRLTGPDTAKHSGDGIAEGRYTPQASRLTYEHLARLTEGLLDAGWPVIVDAAFLARGQRDLFRDLAQRCGAEFRILDIQADPATLRERVSQRSTQGSDASEADLHVLEYQLATAQPLGADELSAVTRISATGGLPEPI